MATLDTYREKRSFTKTPEPTGGKSNMDKLAFVVQKHSASHLHYDFRLEVKGVLKSWAVPKGPSMDPDQHRLAQEVEDHPFDYKDFEGIIPKGQYGGGTVIIWDQGTYEPAEKIRGKKEQEHWMTSNYYKNNVRIKLNGKKLKGEFLLERKKERGEHSWMLSKADDRYASKTDITLKDKSVVSGLTIEQMAENSGANVWNSNRAGTADPPSNKAAGRTDKPPGIKKPFPDRIEPMLSTLVRAPFTDEDWLFEVKFDGFRILSYKNQGKITLRSRKVDYTKEFPLLVEALAEIDRDLILDGEVVALNDRGLPDFQRLQNYKKGAQLKYYVFDLLYLDGYDLTRLELIERRELLQEILPESAVISFSRDFDDGVQLFEAVKGKGLEGIMAKRRDSLYSPGKRSYYWLKIPVIKVQEFVIGGWTESETGQAFRSMLFGYYVDGKLTYVGHVAHGFTEKQRQKILVKLKKQETSRSPFSAKFQTPTKAHWIKPNLVASIEYADWTNAGNIRKPAIFKGWRTDKDPKDVCPEEALSPEEEQQVIASTDTLSEDTVIPSEDAVTLTEVEGNVILSGVEERPPETSVKGRPPEDKKPKQKSPATNTYSNEDSNWKDLDELPREDERELPVDGFHVKVNNLDKILWSDEHISKAALMAYYGSMAGYILPYLKDRPLSLYIKHISPTAPGLYIKDMEGRKPDYAEVFITPRKHKKKGKRDIIEYLVCNNAATLLYIINLGAIDLNPWSSRTASSEYPDYITIDLDPSDEDFSKAIQTALAAKELFDEHKLQSFVKTSGKTGLHILIPCSEFNFPEARTIGSLICDEIQRRLPSMTTRERSVDKRGNLLYVDDSQNDFADTIASAYSVRPYRIPAVSTPLDWKEIKTSLDPAAFTIHTLKKRLEKIGDLFKPLFDTKFIQSNNRQLQHLTSKH